MGGRRWQDNGAEMTEDPDWLLSLTANRKAHLSFVDPGKARMHATASTAALTSHVAWIALGTSAAHAHAQTLYFSVGFLFIRGTVEATVR